MITKSPILEPLRSEKKIYFLFLFNLNPFFCISLPISIIFYFVGIKFLKFFSINNNKDRPTRQTKLKTSSSNASDCAEVAKETASKVAKSKSILSSIKQNNITETLKKIKVYYFIS
jgi:hypothetical protein